MKTLIGKSTLRLVVAILVTVTVIGLSALAMHTPSQNQTAVILKNIQTEKATTFYADHRPNASWFVEAVLPGTNDSNAAADNLKAVAAKL
jgi:hypothetical protein